LVICLAYPAQRQAEEPAPMLPPDRWIATSPEGLAALRPGEGMALESTEEGFDGFFTA
jgi:hypothetical protein